VTKFNGLIQHSFALRLAKEHRPFVGPDTASRIRERFSFPASGGSAFVVRSVCEPTKGSPDRRGETTRIADHSPLVRSGKTMVQPLPISFSLAGGDESGPDLPSAFAWAKTESGELDQRQEGPTFVLGAVDPETEQSERNDYLIERSGCATEPQAPSSFLLEILAHKRSRLFGLALASRIVSVMLPHAVLIPEEGAKSKKSWLVQPLVSFVRDGQERTEFRNTYSLTLLLIPITAKRFGERTMTDQEIDLTVNAGWSLASVPTCTKPPRFRASGPLLEYLPRLAAPYDPAALLWQRGDSGSEKSLTLRQGTEVLAFGLGLRLAQGSRDRATERTVREIAEDVVTSLGSARVSSVLVVGGITEDGIRKEKDTSLSRHHALMATISRETRPPTSVAGYRKYSLDRAFVDDATYVAGVVPAKRCLVVSCAPEAQHGWYQSGLMQAGSLTHMTVGAATAIGTLRAIDRDLEGLEGADPSKIAEIDSEIATDLREVYDLDITSEEYRSLYRRLRKHLGVTRDYKTLQDKMQTLYRATSTFHDDREQKQLAWLTGAIVVLSLLILIGTIVAASK
jgi:hypothetical protein